MEARTLPADADMGQATVTITVSNPSDADRADAGEIAQAEVRRVVLHGVLADTGATNLCLPVDVVQALGLRKIDDVVVLTALGESRAGLYPALLELEGRTRAVSCVALPQGARPLLGAIPMEDLGVELDLRTRTLRVLPDRGPDTYATA